MEDWIDVTERKPTITESVGTFFAVKIKGEKDWNRARYSQAGQWLQVNSDGGMRVLSGVTYWRKVPL